MKRSLIAAFAFFFCVAGLSCGALAQESKDERKKKEPVVDMQVQEVTGEVSYISKRSISLVTSRDGATGEETEILLPYDKTLVVEHKRNLGEIQSGDRISVKYTIEVTDYGNTKDSRVLAKVVTYLNPAGQDSPYRKARETAKEIAAQETAQPEPLSLKGVKSDE